MTMPNTAEIPTVSANDRLGMTLFFAILFHGIFILGITFIALPSAKQKTPPSLDIILVNSANKSKIDKADYLAQISQDGGGSSDEKVRPTDMFSAPSLSQQPGIALEQSVTIQPKIKQSSQEKHLTQDKSDHKIKSKKKTPTRKQHNSSLNPGRKTKCLHVWSKNSA